MRDYTKVKVFPMYVGVSTQFRECYGKGLFQPVHLAGAILHQIDSEAGQLTQDWRIWFRRIYIWGSWFGRGWSCESRARTLRMSQTFPYYFPYFRF
jgi:hypothetical protein